jgi:MOSC domain-containing protein YiiM
MSEDDLHIGDRFRIGSSKLMIRQPRMPCYKLAAKFQRNDMIDRFLHSGRSGFYLSVEQEGEVQQGDAIELISRDESGITIGEMNRLIVRDRYNRALLQKAIATPSMPESWREYFLPRLKGPSVTS